jgi:hypothetical protein
LPWASSLESADAEARKLLNEAVFTQILEAVPEVWLQLEPGITTPAARRAAYVDYFTQRLNASANFVQEAIRARAELV